MSIEFNCKVHGYHPQLGPLISANEVQTIIDGLQAEQNEKAARLTAEVERLKSDLANHYEVARDANAERLQLRTELEAAEKRADALEQEAKIHACELDTQKGIIQSVRDLFNVRVYDFNLISALKLALSARDLEQQIKALEGLKEEQWGNGFRDKWEDVPHLVVDVDDINEHIYQLRQQQKGQS